MLSLACSIGWENYSRSKNRRKTRNNVKKISRTYKGIYDAVNVFMEDPARQLVSLLFVFTFIFFSLPLLYDILYFQSS